MPDSDPSPPPLVSDPVIVDLFAGPGGLDVAAHWLGVPAIGIEFDADAIETRSAAGLATIDSDVRDWKADHFPNATVLAGGPPCQTFTVAGRGSGREDLDRLKKFIEMLDSGDTVRVQSELCTLSDPRTELVLQPLMWILDAYAAGKPFAALMLEQVPQAAQIWRAMEPVLANRGYDVRVDVLHTEEYGVPQTRRRAILIARQGIPHGTLKTPKTTHTRFRRGAAADDIVVGDRLRYRSMAGALGITEPFELISNYGQGGVPGNRGRRRHDEPSFTVTGKVSRNRLGFDPVRSPNLTLPQCGMLQTFPKDYPWSGRNIAQQIGNAIPPRLGAHVLAYLLGLDVQLDDRFFTTREESWTKPEDAAYQRARSATNRDVMERRDVRVISVTPSEDEPFMGEFDSGATIDAVESQPGHEARVAAAV